MSKKNEKDVMPYKDRLDALLKSYRNYLGKKDSGPVEGYSDQFYDGVLWAFARLTELYAGDEATPKMEIECTEHQKVVFIQSVRLTAFCPFAYDEKFKCSGKCTTCCEENIKWHIQEG